MSITTPLPHAITAAFVALTIAFVVTPANAQSKSATVRVPASIRAYETAELYAKVGGYLQTVAVDIGDEVQAGDELAVIDAPELQMRVEQKRQQVKLAEAEIAQAKAKVDEAAAHLKSLQASIAEAESMRAQKQALVAFERSECERIARLAAEGAIQSELLDSARYKLQAAESDLMSVDARTATARANLSGGEAAIRRSQADTLAAEAKANVARADVQLSEAMVQYLTIRAPWPGKITDRMYDPGSYVQSAAGNSAAKPLLRLVRDDQVRVVFSLSQKYIAGLKNGAEVTLGDIEALAGETFNGTVSRFSSELDSKTRMLRVEMDLDNAEGRLRPGFFGYVTVQLGASK